MLDNLLLIPLPWMVAGAAILGLAVGSFLNVVIHRLPKKMEAEWTLQCKEHLQLESSSTNDCQPSFNLMTPGSHCPHCQHAIAPWENIPVLSFLLLKGKCSNCQTAISIRYPLVELITGILSGVAIYYYGPTWPGAFALLFTWALVALTGIDFDTQLLPDDITYPLLWMGLLVNSAGVFTDIYSSLWGAAIGYLSLWSVYWLFKLITGKEGMGYGDFKLLAALGAWMGWQYLPAIILTSSVIGAVVGIALMLVSGRDKNHPFAFGPALAITGWIMMIWGESIIALYWQM